jgi:hypothetical protein
MSGKYHAGEIFINEIRGEHIDSSVAEPLKESLAKMMQTVTFPDSPIKLGESFSHTLPMSLPVPGAAPIQIEITSTYILRDIGARQGQFDMNQRFELSSQSDSLRVALTGRGDGKMVYDRQLSQIISMQTQSAMTMKVSVGTFTVLTDGHTKTEVSLTCGGQ